MDSRILGSTLPVERITMLVKLAEIARKSPKNTFTCNGTKIKAERVWFSPAGLEEYDVIGQKWSARLSFHIFGSFAEDHRFRISFLGQGRDLVEIDVKSTDHLERDLALLRLFGVSDLFPDGRFL